MDTKERFDEEVAAAKAILTEAKGAGRDLTGAENSKLARHLATARDLKLTAELERLAGEGGARVPAPAKKLSAVVKDALLARRLQGLDRDTGIVGLGGFPRIAGPAPGLPGKPDLLRFPRASRNRWQRPIPASGAGCGSGARRRGRAGWGEARGLLDREQRRC